MSGQVKKHIVKLKEFVERCSEIRTWLYKGGGLLTNLANTDTVDTQKLLDYLLTLLTDESYDYKTYELCNGRIIAIHAWEVNGSWDLIVLLDTETGEIVAWEYF